MERQKMKMNIWITKLHLISLTLWSALILTTSPVECRAQGTVLFANDGFPIITNNLQGATGRAARLQYCFGLYMGTSAAAVQNSTTPVLVITNDSFPGIFGAAQYEVPGTYAGNSYYFQVKGWSVAGGPVSYETALINDPLGYFGVSQIGMVFLTVPDGDPSHLFGTSYPQVPAFVMTPIPEPSVLAFGGLAVAAWAGWCWRRPGRNKSSLNRTEGGTGKKRSGGMME